MKVWSETQWRENIYDLHNEKEVRKGEVKSIA